LNGKGNYFKTLVSQGLSQIADFPDSLQTFLKKEEFLYL